MKKERIGCQKQQKLIPMSNLDKELENALREKITEKISQDEDFLD